MSRFNVFFIKESKRGSDRFESAARGLAIALFLFVCVNSLLARPIKEITNVVGVRDNQLMGYGLVVGLNGTGDGTTGAITTQTLANLLQSVNIKVSQNDVNSKNVAAVMVTAKLEPFARQGDRADVQIGSIGDAKSLRGGSLIMTALKGADGKIYALAQGDVSTIGGAQVNSGRIIGGAIIEREARFDLAGRESVVLSLKESSIDNAAAIQNRINERYGERIANAVDARAINIKKPSNVSMVEFLSEVGNLDAPVAVANKVTIDEKSGVIIAGADIRVRPVVISRNAITLHIDESLSQDGKPLTVANIAGALQQVGAGANDVIAIMQALKRSGALEAELEIN
ncbi:MAG: flagellar basal body P-ring protein FlgI [Helicobacteraceae bacterium]|jgi:flagellar P-ring protein precursor FlgI|nr:flagellar basal body P-ring protein FlgI [Helicobacteraceae bacterium]